MVVMPVPSAWGVRTTECEPAIKVPCSKITLPLKFGLSQLNSAWPSDIFRIVPLPENDIWLVPLSSTVSLASIVIVVRRVPEISGAVT